MRITKQKLKAIIIQEVKKKKSELEKMKDNTKAKQAQRRRDTLRYGSEDMRKLSKGIVEYNPFKDENGYPTSAEKAVTYSTYFMDKKRSNLVGKRIPDKDDAGRGKSYTGKGKYKLSTGERNYEESLLPNEEREKRICFTPIELELLLSQFGTEFVDSISGYEIATSLSEQPESYEMFLNKST